MGGGPDGPEEGGGGGAAANPQPPAYAEAVARGGMVFEAPAGQQAQRGGEAQREQQPRQRFRGEAVVEEQLQQLRSEELPLTMVEASDVARQAADAESCGLAEVARDRYEEAAGALRNLARVTRDPNERAALEMQASEYEDHSRAIEKNQNQNQNQTPAVQGVPAPVAGRSNDVVDRFTHREIKSGAQLMGTGMGAGVGAFLGVPILGGAAGFFAANHFVDKEDEHGARTRELGLLGARMMSSARLWNDQYKWTDRAKESASGLWSSTKELNEKHDLTGKAERAATQAGNAVLEFNREHHVTERVSSFASEKIGQLVDGGEHNEKAVAKVNPAEDSK
ncbi:Hypothetical Protein FCC1311_004042 [Hondaea fermentalgiana]|uniref:Uncharacterized protein n=1 Tax=Hondaea fermentalgiana TaxID=2315210 RepID=A0A2R5FZK1_9STRA|nr:Hypothetical Protein FCC1311_004042 [Hondaea fermentalgiana]|eukprot:GBG24186.1 Hypothetical Protein FCC1311_004042 [Hondaea fermentalgiana]